MILKAWMMTTLGYSHEDAHQELSLKWRLYQTRNTAYVNFLDGEFTESVRALNDLDK